MSDIPAQKAYKPCPCCANSVLAHIFTWLIMRPICFFFGHDFYNGGEHCRDCWAPRPAGWLEALRKRQKGGFRGG